MVAAGNDFVVVKLTSSQRRKVIRLSSFARNICDRKFGAGADGLLVLEDIEGAEVRMRIFNADGSEAEMCGNGARCAAYFISGANRLNTKLNIKTKAGIIHSLVNGNNVRINLTDPRDVKLDTPVKVNTRTMKVNFINTGVPHAVIFTEGLEKIDIPGLAPLIRYHKKFSPAGTNVDFIEVLSNDSLMVRTYERGVEDETLACGTGSVASALIFALKGGGRDGRVNVRTKSGEILKVYFMRLGDSFRDVWLEGQARIVYTGEYHV